MKVLLGTVAAGLVLSGCAAFNDEDSASTGRLEVAAAFYPLQFVAERVAGDDASVTDLTTPGTEPHDLELTVSQTAEIANADLVVYEHGFQPAVDAAVEENAEGDVLDAADVVALVEAEEHAEEHADEHAVESEDHAEGEEHEHGEFDPHFWLDPMLLADLGDAVAEQLADVDPDNATAYTERAEALRADLEELDTEYRAGLANCERTTVVVSHDAFGYLGSAYGLEFEPIAGLSPDAEPTPADLARLHELIKAEGITTVFSERLVSPQLSQTLADDLGITTAVLDPIEGLSDETTDEDYLSLMRENLSALELANGCQ